MRISDWSSDVCSSDLLYLRLRRRGLSKFTAWRFLALCDQTVEALASASFQAAPSTTSEMRACPFRCRSSTRHCRPTEFPELSRCGREPGKLSHLAQPSPLRRRTFMSNGIHHDSRQQADN